MTDAERAALLQQQRDNLIFHLKHMFAAEQQGDHKRKEAEIGSLILELAAIDRSPLPYEETL